MNSNSDNNIDNKSNEQEQEQEEESNKLSRLGFLLSSLGWTPELQEKIQNIKCGESPCLAWTNVIFYTIIFMIDLVDAIVDLCLAVQTIINVNSDGDDNEQEQGGEEGDGVDASALRGLSILLISTTLLSRWITGLYGKMADKHIRENREESNRAVNYLILELTIFMLEDGAAILLLVKNPTIDGTLEKFSLYLTLICAGFFIVVLFGFLLFAAMGVCCFGHSFGSIGCCAVTLVLIVLGFPTFLITLLVQQVFNNEDAEPLSEGTETACYVIYGIGAFLMASFSAFAFWGGLQEKTARS